MIKKAETIYRQVLGESKKDSNILGLFLSGSRGKGLPTEHSDFDVVMIVKDGKEGSYKRKYAYIKGIRYIDVYIMGYPRFRKYAHFGGPDHWDRYSFTHVKVSVDKKDIQKLIGKKGRIPPKFVKKYVSGMLDGYINYVYRSAL
ncbi:MAG: nucleotidyltransferase domain-containing protein [Nanoarchaeota archaeon]|nr:nucleotidyltransferase domain-containing protein [Nanoarchaeota archaeon]